MIAFGVGLLIGVGEHDDSLVYRYRGLEPKRGETRQDRVAAYLLWHGLDDSVARWFA